MASTHPATGERLTHIEHIHENIDAGPDLSRDGIGFHAITRPSAGLTAMSSSEGTTLGVPEKCPENQVSTRKTSASG